jgi:tetratricopeptide (TPR) repeat protein
MEVTMASKVKRCQSESNFPPSWSRFTFLIAFSLVLFCLILITGCNEGNQAKGINNAKQISAEEKKAQLLKSLDRKFENPDAHYELGRLYHAEGQWSQAEWRYHRALNFDPVHWQAQAAMVKLFIDSHEPGKSKNYADIYINKVSVSPTQSLGLALAFQNEHLDEYAMTCFQQALSLAPNSAEVHKKIGYFYLSRNDKERAKEYFTRSFQLDPRQPEVAGELGRLGVEVRIPSRTGQNSDNPDKINN